MVTYDRLIFELSQPGRSAYSLPKSNFPEYDLQSLQDLMRTETPCLPEVFETDVVRHYTNISQKNFGVETGFYPLGSCTMKYNPKINDEIVANPMFDAIHPLQPAFSIQGVLKLYHELQMMLS
ncbi:MAG: hypothetical protein PHP61_06170, partial [Candidatus Izemoplasmatales bacterium]|nr:hypothetical protein [Candidatus Izemoplasmatales bacterium]